MASTYTIKSRTVFGDLRVVIYEVTNFTNAETITVPGIRQILHSKAQVKTQDVSIGLTIGTGANANVLTVDSAADTYDGTLIVYGK